MTEKNRYSKTRKAIITILVIALVITVIIIAYNDWKGSQPYGTPIIEERVLLNGTITVNPTYYYIQFFVPSNAFQIKITGNFTVADNNTVRVYIMNETNFKHWDPDFNVTSNYDSGQVISGDIDITLPYGDMYYLIYYKKFLEPEKIVTTQVLLHYLSM